jgi:hypothetical protein
MAGKQNMTLSIDPDIKRAFASEIAINGSKMSETIESYMEAYTKASKKLRDERESK